MASFYPATKHAKPDKRMSGAIAGLAVGGSIATFGAAASTAPFQVALSGLVLAVIVLLLWSEGEPPILLLPPLFQWSEVATVPISTIWKRGDLNDLSKMGADLEASAVYGLLGVLCLAVGIWVARGRLRGLTSQLMEEAGRAEFKHIAGAAFGLMAIGYALAILSGSAGPARELLNSASNIKYVGLMMLAYWCLFRRQHLLVLLATILFELVFGLTGFFAEFKNSLLTIFIAALVARPRLTPRDWIVVGLSLALLIGTAVFWSAIKSDYRLFVNRGTGTQTVQVPLSDRVAYISNEAAQFSGEDVLNGFNLLVERHGYIDFLGKTMAFVPAVRQHEDGALTSAVFQHITMPRFLFPDKPPLPSDTAVMALYTGQKYRWNENTSISIGHLAELYVDFGYYGGLMGMLVIGLMVGAVYRLLRSSTNTPALVAVGLCLATALPIAYFGTAYAKLVGSFLFTSVLALLFQRFSPLFFTLPSPTGRR